MRDKNNSAFWQNADRCEGRRAMASNLVETIRGIPGAIFPDTLFQAKAQFMPFRNILYDYEFNVFWPIHPNDFITKKLAYDFPTESTPNKLDDMLDMLFPIKAEQDFFLHSLYSILDSRSNGYYFFLWIGRGANGKSTLLELIYNAFMPFVTNLPSGFLLKDSTTSTTGAARSDMMLLKNVKLCICSEPTNNTIASDKLNKYAGDDIITERSINEKIYKTFAPKMKFVLAVNTFPTIIGKIDYGVSRRISIIAFRSNFVFEEPEGQYEFKVDKNMQNFVGEKAIIERFIYRVFRMRALCQCHKPSWTN